MSHLPAPLNVVILGTDALLAAQPVDPVQLSRACQRAGFDFVAPVTWGEELVAAHVSDRVEQLGATSSVISSCPFVAEQLRDLWNAPEIISTVSPPVACARYLRAAFRPRAIHITYVGGCPGAAAPDIDERLLPDVLFGQLVDAGIDMAREPRHFDAQIPPERARYASLPGGAPDPDWLMSRSGSRLIEAVALTVDTVAHAYAGCSVVMDLASGSRCTCARNRWTATRLEPPRSATPVVTDPGILISGVIRRQPFEREVPQPVAIEPRVSIDEAPEVERGRRATFAVTGLSAGEAEAPERLTPALTEVQDPWSDFDLV